MITDEKLQEWKELEAAATPGEWAQEELLYDANVIAPNRNYPVALCYSLGPKCADAKHNAAFIAAARTAVPALIAEVERLRVKWDGVPWDDIDTILYYTQHDFNADAELVNLQVWYDANKPDGAE